MNINFSLLKFLCSFICLSCWQYFAGSAYAWLEDTKVKCHNVVPMELATKICDKIALGKP